MPDLLVSLLSLWFIYYSLKNKIYFIYRNPYFLIFITFCLVCITSSILSDRILLSFESSLFYFRIGIFALLISFLIDYNKKILDYFYYTFFITFFVLVVDGYIQYFTGSNILGYQLQGLRVSSFFKDELILGSYLSRLFHLFFALFVARSNKNLFEFLAISILFIFIDILIFLAGERASFVFLNLSTIFIILFISQYKLLRSVVFIISLGIITLLTLNDSKLYDRYISSVVHSTGLDGTKKYMFSEAHDSLIRTGWNMFVDKPILGHGPKLFRIKCKNPIYAEGIKQCVFSTRALLCL